MRDRQTDRDRQIQKERERDRGRNIYRGAKEIVINDKNRQ